MNKQQNRGLRRLALSAALVGGLGICGAAQAFTISQDVPLTGDVSGTLTGGFDSFDSSMGTLTGVNLAWALTLNGGVETDSCLFFGDCEPGDLLWDMGPDSGAFLGEPGPFDEVIHSFGFVFDTDDPQSDTFSLSMADNLDFTNLADFEDTNAGATVGFLVNTMVPDGFVATQTYELGGTFTLTYAYDEDNGGGFVPAPATLALLGLDLAGLGVRRRNWTA